MLSFFKKILFYSFFVFIFFGGVFGLQEVWAGCDRSLNPVCGVVNYTCNPGIPDRYSEDNVKSYWYCNGMTLCESSCKNWGDCPSQVLCSGPLPTYSLIVDNINIGTGSGTVTGSGTYNSGATVTATASPSADSVFVGWAADCNANGQVTMTSAKKCTAIFNSYILAIKPCKFPTVTLTANPSSIIAGSSSALTWNVENTTSCTATGAEVLWAGSNLATSTGEHTWPTGILNTLGTHTYGITCTGNNGATTVTANATVTVNPDIIDNPLAVTGGANIAKCQAVDVSWDPYPGADNYYVTCSGIPSCDRDSVSTSSSDVTIRNLTPDTNYSFIIKAYNSSDELIASSITNSIKPGPVCPAGLTGNCVISKDLISPSINNTTTWTVGLTPACPDCTYTWSGTNINPSLAPTSNPLSKIYTTIGLKNISVLVKNSIGLTFCTASATTTVSFTGGTTIER
jgi:hypothetical protein